MIRAYVGSFVSLAGVTAGLTWLYLGMRSVMEVGGACADGGPYVSAQPCPEGVPFLMVGGIFGGLICLGLFMWFGSRLGGSYVGLAGLAWPALFLSLGWNFFEFSFDPPGDEEGIVWGWLICGVIFALMGGLPLLYYVVPKNLMAILWPADPGSPRASRDEPYVPRPIRSRIIDSGPLTPTPRAPAAPPPPATGASAPDDAPADELVDALERLAKLRASGALDAAEYERAKKAVLDG